MLSSVPHTGLSFMKSLQLSAYLITMLVEWYTSSGVSPNITVLGMEGLPKEHAGQKGGRPKKQDLGVSLSLSS